MTKDELISRIEKVFNIESGNTSLDELEDLTQQALDLAQSPEQVDKIVALSDAMVEKYKMTQYDKAIVAYIADALLLNLRVDQIEYVLDAYSSEVYSKFFTIIGDVLDAYAKDATAIIDAGISDTSQQQETTILM